MRTKKRKTGIYTFYSLATAEFEGLIRLTVWLAKKDSELEFLKKEYDRIGVSPDRDVMLVEHNGKWALFVNDIS